MSARPSPLKQLLARTAQGDVIEAYDAVEHALNALRRIVPEHRAVSLLATARDLIFAARVSLDDDA